MTDTTQAADAPALPETQAPAAPEINATVPADSSPEPEGEPSDDSAPSQEDHGTDPAAEPQPKKKGGFQKKIDELTREKYEAALRAEIAERKLAEISKQSTVDLSADPGPEPQLDQFEYIDDFKKAYQTWAKSQGYRQAQTETTDKQRQEQAIATQAKLNTRVDDAKRKYADFGQTVKPIAAIVDNHPVLSQFAVHSEAGPDVLYHLAKNPDALGDIIKLDPFSALRELTKLEARLSTPPPAKPVTNAPAPIKPVGARETVARTLADEAASDDASAYIARMNKQRAN